MDTKVKPEPFTLRMVKQTQRQFRLELTNISDEAAQSIRFQLYVLPLIGSVDTARRSKIEFDDVMVLEPKAKTILQPTEKTLSISDINEAFVRLTREGADGKRYQLRIFLDHPHHAHQIVSLGEGSDVSFPRD